MKRGSYGPSHVGCVWRSQLLGLVAFQSLAGFDAQVQIQLVGDAPDGECKQLPDNQNNRLACGATVGAFINQTDRLVILLVKLRSLGL
jgi:hypothetical protein